MIVGIHAARIHRPKRLTVASPAIMAQPRAGSAAVHNAPVQSSFTSWRKLNAANTESGKSTARVHRRLLRASSGGSPECGLTEFGSPECGSRAGRANSTPATANSPVGVISTMMEPINLCSANCGVSASRRDVWKAKDAHSCCAFQTRTGEKMASASRAATYGSARRHQQRDVESHSMKSIVTGTNIAMEYFEIIPRPKEIPANHQARDWLPISARSRKYSEAAHAAARGASGVMSRPERKK